MICDTTFLIDLRARSGSNRHERARVKLHHLVESGEILQTTRFNVAELYVGVERSDDPVSERKLIERIISRFVVLDFDDRAAQVFGRITAELQRVGKPIGDMDALIASIAIANGEAIVTRNSRHFELIPGLSVQSY